MQASALFREALIAQIQVTHPIGKFHPRRQFSVAQTSESRILFEKLAEIWLL